MWRADAGRALTRWQHFSAWNDVIAAILKVWRQLENPTPSIDAYLLEKNNAPNVTHSDPFWNDDVLGFLEDDDPNNKWNKMSSDMGSVPGPKKSKSTIVSTPIKINRVAKFGKKSV